ncbi:MAG: thiolase family protein [Gammaproteobacteria bacterium]|nr:thiolase family protein [Gammaproteobacteria bacterium]
MSQDYSGVALLAPTTVGYQRYSDHGAAWFIGRCVADLLAGAGVAKDELDGLAVSSMTLAPDSAVSLTEHFGLTTRWLEHVPMGGAAAVVSLRRAARAIQAGDARVIACVAGDTNRKGGFRDAIENFSVFSRQAVYPYGAAGPNVVFALITRAYMAEFGATREDFGRICIAQRENASHNPVALLRDPLDMQTYLDARPIAEPVHLFDCVLPCAGAEGFLVTSVERARSLDVPFVEILAVDERHNAFPEDPVQLRGGWAMFRDELYAAAGLGPGDMNFVQAYDDYPVIALQQLEDLGFCDKGAGPEFVRHTELTCTGGGLPLNTCGGQLSAGQAGFAGGHLGTVEAIRQLTGQVLGQQVPDASVGIVSGYGMVNYDRCLCSAAAILRRADS